MIISHDPQAVLHVIEGNQAVIEHQHRIEQSDFIAQPLGQTFDEPNHVVTEITDRAGNQRRQTWQAHGPVALHVRAQKRDWVLFFPYDAVTVLQYAGTVRITKNLFRICPGKRVARNFFAALDALEEKRKARSPRDSQIRADGRQQVSRKDVVNGDEISLLGEPLKFLERRLNHEPGPD